MMRRFSGRLVFALTLGVGLSTVLGCERDASGLTEWTPADHDHQAEPRMRRTMANMQQKANPHSAPSQKNQVIDVTWMKQCATCHGRRGKGDGPSSTMVKARDLTNAEFQATLTDEQIAKVIREGKDKMPAFNLPDSIIEGLVQHVRGLVRKKRANDDDSVEAGDDEAAEAEAAAPNAPASAGSAPATAAGSAPSAADKAPQAPTQTQPAGAAPTGVSPAAVSPAAVSPSGAAPAAPTHGTPAPTHGTPAPTHP